MTTEADQPAQMDDSAFVHFKFVMIFNYKYTFNEN